MKTKPLLAGLSVFLLLGPASLQAQELLKNPGFENGKEAWSFKEGDTMSTVIPEAARKGSFGLRIEDKSESLGSGPISERFPVKPGQKAKLEFWARTKDEKFVTVSLVYFASDKTWTTDGNEQLPSVVIKDVSGKWTKYELEAVIPDHVDAIAVWTHSWSTSQGLADFDDFELKIK